MDKQVAKLMTLLKISEEEARQVIADDKAIDRGAKLFELSPELAEGAKKARRAERKVTDTPTKREKKIDNDKRFLIDSLVWLLTTDVEQTGDNVCAEAVEILNPERELTFIYNGRKYKLTLSCPRS